MILTYEGSSFEQRELDGYVNLTDMAKIFQTDVYSWTRTKSSKAYIKAVSDETKICGTELLVYCARGTTYDQSTWAHPLIAIAFAQWLSPRFHVWCNIHIKQIIEKSYSSTTNIYARRVQIASNWNIPKGYFCVFHEISLLANKIGEEYQVREYDLIDGSVGKCWSKYRKEKEWALPTIKFPIEFGDKRDLAHVEVTGYSNHELIYFREWLEDIYRYENLPKYLSGKYSGIL